MTSSKNKTSVKDTLDVLTANSYVELISNLNTYNTTHKDTPILKEDIVEIRNYEGTFILLYYK